MHDFGHFHTNGGRRVEWDTEVAQIAWRAETPPIGIRTEPRSREFFAMQATIVAN